MIWTHETTIDINDTEIVFGWDVIGEDYAGSFFEPPTSLEIEWEQLTRNDIELSDSDIRYIDDVLWDELEDMKTAAMESIAEDRAWDMKYA